jgi:hypothetical protein
MNRRSLLRAAGLLGGSVLAGCLSGSPASGKSQSTPSPQPSQTASPSPTVSSSPSVTPYHTPSEPVRCQGAVVSAERSITDEPGYDDGVEYFPINETVRFVAARSGGEPAEFGTWTVEEWGTIESAEIGLARAREVTADRLGTSEFASGVGTPPAATPTEARAIFLEIVTELDRDGKVLSTSPVSLSQLVDAGPRSVDVTLSLDGETFERTLPVFAKSTLLRLE